MESRQCEGNLQEPNLKHCHDGSWKRVKVGGSVIFKDEPKGEGNKRPGSDRPKEEQEEDGEEEEEDAESYFHPDVVHHLQTPLSKTLFRLQQALQSSSYNETVGYNLQILADRSVRQYTPPSKQLHPEQSKHHSEEEEEEKQADDGLHGAHQRNNQVSERGPVPDNKKDVFSINLYCLDILYGFVQLQHSLSDFENPQKSQRPQDADTERHPRPEETPNNFKDAANNNL